MDILQVIVNFAIAFTSGAVAGVLGKRAAVRRERDLRLHAEARLASARSLLEIELERGGRMRRALYTLQQIHGEPIVPTPTPRRRDASVVTPLHVHTETSPPADNTAAHVGIGMIIGQAIAGQPSRPVEAAAPDPEPAPAPAPEPSPNYDSSPSSSDSGGSFSGE